MLDFLGPINWKKVLVFSSVVIGVVVLVVILVPYYPHFRGFVLRTIRTPTPSPGFLSKIIEVKGGELPENLPKDIILEKDIQVIRSYYTKPFPYNKELTIYQVQSFFSFFSKRSPEENFNSYNKYLKEKGWQVIDLKESKDTKIITAIKEKEPNKLEIRISSYPGKEGMTIVSLFNIHIGLYAELNKK